MPGADIESARGTIPIGLRHELYEHPSASVIRIVLTIYDRPAPPLAVETFINVQEAQQRADYAALAEQRELNLLFYDEWLAHRLSKGAANLDAAAIQEILHRAAAWYQAIPEDRFSFEIAKAWVLEHTSL